MNYSPMELPPDILAKILLKGDITDLNSNERILYYNEYCKRLGLDPGTRPFTIMEFKDGKDDNGKERPKRAILYPNKNCAQQLNRIHKISHDIKSIEQDEESITVIVRATTPEGQFEDGVGGVPIIGKEYKWDSSKNKNLPTGKMVPLSIDDRLDARSKAITQAKMKSTFDLVGLGTYEAEDNTALENPNLATVRVISSEPKKAVQIEQKPQLSKPPLNKQEQEIEDFLNKPVEVKKAPAMEPSKSFDTPPPKELPGEELFLIDALDQIDACKTREEFKRCWNQKSHAPFLNNEYYMKKLQEKLDKLKEEKSLQNANLKGAETIEYTKENQRF